MGGDFADFVARVAPIFVGGGLVQLLIAWWRKRGELRQMDRATDSVAVDTMEKVIVRLRSELDDAKGEIVALQEESHRKDAQVEILARRVVKAETAVRTLRAEVQLLRAAGV